MQCHCDSDGHVQCKSKECVTYECLPGQVERHVGNTTCCGPSIVCECNADDCPPAPQCAPFWRLVEERPASAGQCCPQYRCLPPEGVCIYHSKNGAGGGAKGSKGSKDGSVASYAVNQTWSDGACVDCRCEDDEFADTKASAVCQKRRCSESSDDDYVLTPVPIDMDSEQCCPLLVRTACKDGNNIYQVSPIRSNSNDM